MKRHWIQLCVNYREEASVEGINWIQLDSMTLIPKIYFKNHQVWHEHPYVIPALAFITLITSEPKASCEHSELKWCSINEASRLLHYDSNKTALWELSQRLGISFKLSQT